MADCLPQTKKRQPLSPHLKRLPQAATAHPSEPGPRSTAKEGSGLFGPFAHDHEVKRRKAPMLKPIEVLLIVAAMLLAYALGMWFGVMI